MSTVALSGNDTVVINDHVFNDFAEGNVVELTFPNDIANVKTGKNGNTIYGLNEMGKQCDLKMRLIRGSNDDIFMNQLLNLQYNNFAETVLMQGSFIKKIGDGQGNIINDTYILGGGVFIKQVEGLSNVEGDATQSVSVYQMKFGLSPRAIT